MPDLMSSWFVRTLREEPAEADLPSHRLLLRAGYVRRVAAGGYAWLPLGLAVLRNVERIVREEMDRIGAQEVLLPALPPHGPAGHQQLFALLAKAELSSYKDLPLAVYQVRTGFRDDQRPRLRLPWTREFVLADACSFDLTNSGLEASYGAHREAYLRIFARLGLDVVSAVSGPADGLEAEKFLVPTPAGEDTFASCGQCGYAADTGAVPSPRRPAPVAEPGPVEELDTPDTPTIQTLAAHLKVPASATLKNLLLIAGDAGDEVVAVGVPGDREVDLGRVEALLGPVRIFEAADFAAHPELVRGYVGPQGLAGRAFRYVADRRVSPGTSWVTGANRVGTHARNVVAGRDFEVCQYADVVTVVDGDPCPRCGGPLALARGVEVGHAGQLGRACADAVGLDLPGPDGTPVRPAMGSYGIGISSAIAAVAEQHHDARGLAWPREVSPYDVEIVPVGRGDQPAHARDLAARLADTGLRVLVDDREASAGVKLTDAELIGVPWTVVVGRRADEGVVEVRDRAGGGSVESRLDDVVWAVTR